MMLGCEEVQEALRLGDEGEDVLEHLAHCAACRARAESTLFVGGGATEKRPSAMVRHRLPWLVAIVLVPLIGVLTVLAATRTHPSEPTVEAAHPATAAKVTPIELPSEPPTVGPRHLSVDSDPVATVFIEGERKGPTPWRGEVPPGRVVVEVRAEGFRSARKIVKLGDPDPAPLVFRLDRADHALAHTEDGAEEERSAPVRSRKPVAAEKESEASDSAKQVVEKPAATDDNAKGEAKDDRALAHPAMQVSAPSGFGYLTITCEPWAKVIIDGKDIGRSTPLSRYATAAGHHTVELRARTGALTIEVNVAPKQDLEIDKTIE